MDKKTDRTGDDDSQSSPQAQVPSCPDNKQGPSDGKLDLPQGYDDSYGYKSPERVKEGEYYANERKYHDAEYHQDRAAQEDKYEMTDFEGGNTPNAQHARANWYPSEWSDAVEHRYLENGRTSISEPPGKYYRNEKARREATQGNRDADRDRRAAGVASRDFAYAAEHPLHEGYKTAKNARDHAVTGQDPTNEEIMQEWVEEENPKPK